MAPSLADQMLFDALPDDTRAAVIRLYGGPPTGLAPSEDLLVLCYRMGFDDAMEEMGRVSCTASSARRAVTQLMERLAFKGTTV